MLLGTAAWTGVVVLSIDMVGSTGTVAGAVMMEGVEMVPDSVVPEDIVGMVKNFSSQIW